MNEKELTRGAHERNAKTIKKFQPERVGKCVDWDVYIYMCVCVCVDVENSTRKVVTL
jgi:hypothetical protein